MRDYLDFITTGDIKKDTQAYFLIHDRKDTYEHTLDVIKELQHIERQQGRIVSGSTIACYLHDLGRVVKNDEIIEFCNNNQIVITNEERQLPSILHQKISCFIAKELFGVSDKTILDAIRYHTTLRKNPSMIEIEVFLSDKMSWKEDGYRELALKIKEELKESKEKAVYYYLNNLHINRKNLELYHTDTKEAYDFFEEKYNLK